MAKIKNNFGHMVIWAMILIVIASASLVFILSASFVEDQTPYINTMKRLRNPFNFEAGKHGDIVSFQSSEDLKNYMNQVETSFDGYYGNMMLKNMAPTAAMEGDAGIGVDDTMGNYYSEEASRYSGTNVQVAGIDEPDIVKSNGKEIFFSGSNRYYWGIETPMMTEDVGPDAKIMMPDYYQPPKTSIISAFPPEDLDLSSQIEQSGDMLLSDNTLVFLNGNDIVAYDVSDKKNPQKSWTIKLDSRQYYNTARLMDGKIYLVTNSWNDRNFVCPMDLLSINGTAVKLDCNNIYHPTYPIEANITYTTTIIDAKTGEIKDKIALLGSSSSSVVYMSNDNLFITYAEPTNDFDFLYNFIKNKASDLLPNNLVMKLDKVYSYDISQRAKMLEFETLIENWMNSLDRDEEMRISNEMENRLQTYLDENKRNLFLTNIVKISLDKLEIAAKGIVPGSPLNQFSLDEYQGNLRIATTIGNTWIGLGSISESANDVYVLDNNLRISGYVSDLGLTEQIYSVRFIADKGYVVTFKKIDPFYVLDLSDPKNPQKSGELKIPGYSSYLHPITENKILGIGVEDGQVKISYFDVSNPSEPKEAAKYTLDEYGSEALYDHHAFLLDKEHQVFFLPGYQGGYIFSYADDQLELVRTVSLEQVKRALYIDNYLYIIAENYIVALDESDWQKVNDLEFGQNQ